MIMRRVFSENKEIHHLILSGGILQFTVLTREKQLALSEISELIVVEWKY